MTWDRKKIAQQRHIASAGELPWSPPPDSDSHNSDEPIPTVRLLGQLLDSSDDEEWMPPLHIARQMREAGLWTPQDVRQVQQLMMRGIPAYEDTEQESEEDDGPLW